MALKISTNSVPFDERSAFWDQACQRLFKDRCQVESKPDTSFQVDMSVLKVGPFTLSDCQGSSFRMMRRGCDETGGLILLIQNEGECVIRAQDREAHLSPANLCLFPANIEAELEMHGAFRQLGLRFQSGLLSELHPTWEQQALSAIRCDSGSGAIFHSLVHAMFQHGESALTKCCLDAFQATLVLLGGVLNENKPASSPSPLAATRLVSFHKTRIREFVLENLSNPELDVPMIALAMQLSSRYLHRLFSDEPMQLMHWILSERLARCLDDLASEEKHGTPISAIAYAWGFNDPAHFSRSFRKRYGVSPREVQRYTSHSEIHVPA